MIKRITTSVLTLVLMAGVANAQTSADIHGDPGCAPSSFDGSLVTLTGVIYSVAGTYNSGAWYMQDNTSGGMTWFDSSLAGLFNEGDEVEVTGTVGAFGDEIQLNGVTLNILSTGNPVAAIPFGTGDLADGTDQLGALIEVEGVLAQTSSGFNSAYTVDDGTGPCIVFVDGTTGIDQVALDAMIGDIVRIKGASKCFGGEGEVLPRRDSDITLVTVATEETSFGQVKASYND